MAKQGNTLLIVLGGLALLFVLSFGYFLWQNQPKTNSSSKIESHPSTTTTWKTYNNPKLDFLVKHDSKITPNEIVIPGSIQQLALIAFGSVENSGFEIEVSTGDDVSYYKYQITDHMSEKIDQEETISVDKIPATKLTYRQIVSENKPAQSVSKVIVKNNSYDYIITALAKDIDQIISTIKFTGKIAEKGEGDSTSQVVSVPKTWKSFSSANSFKASGEVNYRVTLSLPPGFSFAVSGLDELIQNDSDATELWDYNNSISTNNGKNYYDGRSRREWYKNYLEGKFPNLVSPISGSIQTVVEHFFNNSSYLEVTVKTSSKTTEKHYLFVQNGILNILVPASKVSLDGNGQIPKYLDVIFSSLKVTLP